MRGREGPLIGKISSARSGRSTAGRTGQERSENHSVRSFLFRRFVVRYSIGRMKGDDIADRLLGFAKRVLGLCRRFPEDFAGKHVARQLRGRRSGSRGTGSDLRTPSSRRAQRLLPSSARPMSSPRS